MLVLYSKMYYHSRIIFNNTEKAFELTILKATMMIILLQVLYDLFFYINVKMSQ